MILRVYLVMVMRMDPIPIPVREKNTISVLQTLTRELVPIGEFTPL
jgi:hypothetical protein